MKVALLLYGQPRGVDKEDVWRSHKKFIMDKYDTDVYCHMWYDATCKIFDMSSHATNTNSSVVPQSDSIILERYKPIQHLFEPPRVFDASPYIQAFNEGGYTCSANFPNYISQLYSVEQVATLCKRSDIKYDMIIVARYDIVIDSFPDLDELNPKFFYCMNNHPRFPDLFFIFSNMYLDSQFVYSGLKGRIKKYGLSGNIWEPSVECMKFLKYTDLYSLKNLRGVEILEHRV